MTNDRKIFVAVLAAAAAETLFWIYTFYYIDVRTNLRGDGMEWLAEVPMTMIFLFGVVPALVIGVARLVVSALRQDRRFIRARRPDRRRGDLDSNHG